MPKCLINQAGLHNVVFRFDPRRPGGLLDVRTRSQGIPALQGQDRCEFVTEEFKLFHVYISTGGSNKN